MSDLTPDSKDTNQSITNKKRNKESEEKSTNNTITPNENYSDSGDDDRKGNYYDLFDDEEDKIGEIEYTKNLIAALKEAIEENDKLRQYAFELTKQNEELKKEMIEKDDVIRELAQYYQVRYILYIK